MNWLAEVFKQVAEKPVTIFVAIAVFFGYIYWEQTKRLQVSIEASGDLKAEIQGLRVEQQKMNEIIKLKVKLAEEGCKK